MGAIGRYPRVMTEYSRSRPTCRKPRDYARYADCEGCHAEDPMRAAVFIALSILTSLAPSQVITLPPGPVAPGSLITVTVFNNTASDLLFPLGNGPMVDLRHS